VRSDDAFFFSRLGEEVKSSGGRDDCRSDMNGNAVMARCVAVILVDCTYNQIGGVRGRLFRISTLDTIFHSWNDLPLISCCGCLMTGDGQIQSNLSVHLRVEAQFGVMPTMCWIVATPCITERFVKLLRGALDGLKTLG
jgi:hypothetical protein